MSIATFLRLTVALLVSLPLANGFAAETVKVELLIRPDEV
jgi:hypothetical protein